MRKPQGRRPQPRQVEELHRINNKIIAREVRIVREGAEPLVLPTPEAIALAESQELDLVEISPNAVPPVCKILDYRKFLYDQKKKQKELLKKLQGLLVYHHF
jgi:translation initiation factor IF-3